MLDAISCIYKYRFWLFKHHELISFSTWIDQNSCVNRFGLIRRPKAEADRHPTPKKACAELIWCEPYTSAVSFAHTHASRKANCYALNLRYVTEFKAFLIRLVLMFYQRSLHPKHMPEYLLSCISFAPSLPQRAVSWREVVVVVVAALGCAI